jgi:hypothetical protein
MTNDLPIMARFSIQDPMSKQVIENYKLGNKQHMDEGVYMCAQWKNLQTSVVQTINKESKHNLHSLLLANNLRPTTTQ